MKKFEKKYAFTAAETLLTLLLIGIVISLSLPTIMLSYKKTTTAAILKDIYKELNSAITNTSIKKGCTGDLICKDLLTNFARNLASEYQIIKFCGEDDNCWNDKVYFNVDNSILNAENASTYINYNSIGQNFIDAKDRIYNIVITDTGCNTDESENVSETDIVPKNHKLKRVCGYITVDINGKKNLSTHGTDVFKFVLTNTRNNYIYPYGGKYHNKYWKTHNSCQPESDYFDGQSCAGRIMEENWKINYFTK